MKMGPLKINFRHLGTFVVIGIVLLLVMNFNARLGELAHLQNQEATVRVQATGVKITQVALITQLARVTSPAEVDAHARSEAHMSKPGDKVVIVLPDPKFTPQPAPTATPAVNDLSPWKIWMIFIFGN
ncbi:MAG: hypothetical protein WCK35_18745 [Chloroflexota bacterium]